MRTLMWAGKETFGKEDEKGESEGERDLGDLGGNASRTGWDEAKRAHRHTRAHASLPMGA